MGKTRNLFGMLANLTEMRKRYSIVIISILVEKKAL